MLDIGVFLGICVFEFLFKISLQRECYKNLKHKQNFILFYTFCRYFVVTLCTICETT